MRNEQVLRLAGLVCVAALAAGCPPKVEKTPGPLDRAYTALEARDYAGAASAADEQIAAKGASARSVARAYYVKGRAVEGRTKPTPAANAADLAEARSLYERALASKPDADDEAKIRSGLANVAYFQDDFLVAMSNWTSALERTKPADDRAWMRYRIGLCQQRLGRFDQADRTFEQVQRTHPDTEPARRALKQQGARAFTVQVATFTRDDTATKLIDQLKARGLTATKIADAGKHVVSVPNLPTYAAAKAVKGQVEGDYPDAVVVP